MVCYVGMVEERRKSRGYGEPVGVVGICVGPGLGAVAWMG